MIKTSELSPVLSVSPLKLDPAWLENLFQQNAYVWVGFSGGVDSHVLLNLLAEQVSAEQKKRLKAIHIHHGLNEKADAWLEHCKGICQAFNVEFFSKKVQLEVQASIEDAARNARYQAFEDVMAQDDVLLLAHHAGDQSETVLFRMLRGTGLKGLMGMPQERTTGHARLMRPLLAVTKEQIEAYAHQYQLKWVEDDSNSNERFSRNFLRQTVMPLLKQRFAKLDDSIALTTRRIRTDYHILSRFALQQLDSWCNEFGGLELAYIAQLNLDERIFWLQHFLQSNGHSLSHVQLENLAKMLMSSEDKQPEFICQFARLMRHQEALYILPLEQEVLIGNLVTDKWLERSFDCICVHGEGCSLKPRPKGVSLLMPSGNSRKLKKWLNDQGIPSWWRDHLPYVYFGDDLVAIGDLWRHPKFQHLKIEWQRKKELPLPHFSI